MCKFELDEKLALFERQVCRVSTIGTKMSAQDISSDVGKASSGDDLFGMLAIHFSTSPDVTVPKLGDWWLTWKREGWGVLIKTHTVIHLTDALMRSALSVKSEQSFAIMVAHSVSFMAGLQQIYGPDTCRSHYCKAKPMPLQFNDIF